MLLCTKHTSTLIIVTLNFTVIPNLFGHLDSVDWNGEMEFNGNKLDASDWFSPPYKTI